jgi:hypothetical protein
LQIAEQNLLLLALQKTTEEEKLKGLKQNIFKKLFNYKNAY